MTAQKRRGRTSLLGIDHEKLPAQAAAKVTLSQPAKGLVARYQMALQRYFARKRFPKGWLQRQFLSAEKIIRLCGGDLETAAAHLKFGLESPCFRGQVKQSLYHALKVWRRLATAYMEREASRQASANVHAPATAPATDSAVLPTSAPAPQAAPHFVHTAVSPPVADPAFLESMRRTTGNPQWGAGYLNAEKEVHGNPEAMS